MLGRNTPLLFGCVFILVTGGLSVLGQEKKIELKDKRITIQMAGRPLYTVFTRLINKYDVAIGLEESALDSGHQRYYFDTNVAPDDLKAKYSGDKEFFGSMPRFSENLITVNFKNARLEDVMDAIVKQMQNYDWEISDDVVNIFPIRGRNPSLKKLVDLRIREFATRPGDDVGTIQPLLMLSLPEFKSFLAETGLEVDTARPGSLSEERLLLEGMNFCDLTFKELLNAITKSKRGGWILRIKEDKSKPGKEFIQIFI